MLGSAQQYWRTLLCASLLTCMVSHTSAQTHSACFGFGTFGSFAVGPVKKVGTIESMGETFDKIAGPRTAWNLLYGSAGYRGLLASMGKNASISIFAYPSIGLGIQWNRLTGGTGFSWGQVNMNIPVYLELNVGAGATYESTYGGGLVLGLGVDLNLSPLNGDPNNPQVITEWFNVGGEAGFRWNGRKDKLKEIKLQVGVGKTVSYRDINTQDTESNMSGSFRVTWVHYFH